MVRVLLRSLWGDESKLLSFKHYLDGANIIALLVVAMAGLVIACKIAKGHRRRVLELCNAILGIALVFTSVYLSPAIADRIAEVRVWPRHITQEQRDKFVIALKNAPHGSVHVRANELDAEVSNYTDEIRSLLDAAGYSGDASTDMGERVLSTTSIAIALRSQADAPPYAAAIQKAFEKIGISALAVLPRKTEVAQSFVKPGEMYVFVNKRP